MSKFVTWTYCGFFGQNASKRGYTKQELKTRDNPKKPLLQRTWAISLYQLGHRIESPPN